jgi:glycosyltransferase involved in cell wall biosynthesis
MKKKVAIIIYMPSPYRVDLFNYLFKNTDYDFTVIYSTSNEDNRHWSKDINFKHKSIFLKSKTIKIRKRMDNKYIHIPFNIKSTLEELNPDIVVASEYNPTSIKAFSWCKRHNVKYISWSDGTLNSERDINVVQKIFRKKICKNAVALISSSSKTKEAQMHYGAEESKIHMCYLTMDIFKYIIKEREYGNTQLLYTGRLIKGKGLDLLFDALKEIKVDYCLNIVGDGPEEEELKKLAEKTGIAPRVIFNGFKSQAELLEYYKKADIFILPTRIDCFGLVITEAMCAGLPIIASKYADGVYDLIEEGKNGFVIDPYDYKALSAKIEYLLRSPMEIKKMGEYSLNKVLDFSIEKVSVGFLGAISSLEYDEGIAK